MSCSNASPVAAETVDHMLNYMPSRGLIQHEWQKHGTCTGLSAQDYFARRNRRTQVSMYRSSIGGSGASSNSSYGSGKEFCRSQPRASEAFRVSCHAGELVSLEVCVDKNLQYRSCTQSVRECPVNQVDMRPPQ